MTVSQGYFNFGVAERGQVIGLIICALALTAISAPQPSPLLGAGSWWRASCRSRSAWAA